MYTEIRELVNFLARYLHLRVPRLKIGMFSEHMANNCLLRFQPYWNINQPKQHEEQRIIVISRIFCDEVFTSAANSVGVLLEEVLNCLPDRLILYVNPGEVFYCSSDYTPPVPIWLGSVNEDLSYEQKQTNASATIQPQPLPSSILPGIQPLNSLFAAPPITSVSNVDFSTLDWRVQLVLVHPRELGYTTTHNPYNEFLMFRYVGSGTPNFTVETFAATRFGSYRKRPDHENIVRLQRSALMAAADNGVFAGGIGYKRGASCSYETTKSTSNPNTNTTISDQELVQGLQGFYI